MAFDPISYTYVPTAPRPKKRTTTHRKPYPKPPGVYDRNQSSKPNEGALGITHLSSAAAAHDLGSDRARVQAEIDAVCDGISNDRNDNNDDDYDFPRIEEILGTVLREQGFPAEDYSTDNTNGGFKKVALGERGGSIDYSRSAPSDGSGKSQDNSIVLKDDDPKDCETDVDCGSQRAESAESDGALFSSLETTFDWRTSVSPSPGECHDIETAQHLRLTEQDAATSDPIQYHSPSSRPSSEPLHDHINAEDNCTDHARSETITSHPAHPCNRSSRRSRLSPLNQLSQENHRLSNRSATDEHKPVRPPLNTDKEDKKQEVSGGSGGDDDDDAQPQRQVSPEPIQGPRGSHGDGGSNDELNSSEAESGEEARRPRPKRKRSSLSHAGPVQKKRKHHLQQRSTRQSRAHSNSRRFLPKSQSVLDHVLRATLDTGAESRLPSPTPSAARTMNTAMSSPCYNLGHSSSDDILPTLTEVTFRPHSTHCYSFTAVVMEGCDGHGVSFSQLAQLIESIGHVGKIDDFTIKPLREHLFLLTGFSQHTSSRLSSSGTTMSTAAVAGIYRDATHIRSQQSKAVDSEALTSQGNKQSSSNNDDGLSDSDPDPSSNDDGCSSEDEHGRSRTSKRSQWSDLDEQRLLAYKKEGKSWDWIFRKFPGRTKPAVRTRWNMVRPRGE